MARQLDLFDGISPALTLDEMFARFTAQQFVACKEHRRVEKKPIGLHAREMCEYLSMWSNTPPDGGIMVIGVEKDGTLAGCASNIDRVNSLECAGHDCCPDARIEIRHVPFTDSGMAENFLLIVRTRYREDRVVKTGGGKAYIRRGESKHLLANDEVRELESDKGQIPFELESCGLSYPGDFNFDAISTWASKAKEVNNWQPETTAEQAMVSLKLGRIDQNGQFVPNIACALLFSKGYSGFLVGFPGGFAPGPPGFSRHGSGVQRVGGGRLS
jgi:ATP-dependent DNA helicase RecG